MRPFHLCGTGQTESAKGKEIPMYNSIIIPMRLYGRYRSRDSAGMLIADKASSFNELVWMLPLPFAIFALHQRTKATSVCIYVYMYV
jgi:hypothetical protein